MKSILQNKLASGRKTSFRASINQMPCAALPDGAATPSSAQRFEVFEIGSTSTPQRLMKNASWRVTQVDDFCDTSTRKRILPRQLKFEVAKNWSSLHFSGTLSTPQQEYCKEESIALFNTADPFDTPGNRVPEAAVVNLMTSHLMMATLARRQNFSAKVY